MDVAGELATIAGRAPCAGDALHRAAFCWNTNKISWIPRRWMECADMVLARYAMPALRARHASGKEETAEQPMTTARLAKRLAVNAGAMVLGNTLFTAPLLGGALANFTSLEALGEPRPFRADGKERARRTQEGHAGPTPTS